MSEVEKLSCPFVYAGGRQCCGHVAGWRVYGWRKDDPLYLAKKVRLWCSEKDDHAGMASSLTAKERMEFYPDKLPRPVYEAIEAAGDDARAR